jgi:NAD(P)-dependent dehydrogenase (short-subunit alcohol dehydrogenase family)
MSTTITTTNKRRLSGKYALITGGSTGIGLATAKQFAEEGARVAVTGMDSERLAAAVRELPSNALALRADARSATDIATMFSEIQQHFGKLDIHMLCTRITC